jgi:hypothetical protein
MRIPRKLVPLLALGFAGCAAAPVLEKYPERQIDRPYTLPKDVASWETLFGSFHEKDGMWNNHTNLIYPLIWNQSLSDTWQLTWMPLPLIVSHEITRDETGYWGASLGTGASHSSYSGLTLWPTALVKRRQIISPDFALDATVTGNFRVPFRSGDFRWTGDLTAAPLFQVRSNVALGPTLSVRLEEEVLVAVDVTDDDWRVTTNRTRKVRYPIGAYAQWLMSKQWELSFSHTYYRLGYDSDFTRRDYLLTLTHFW